MNETGLKESWIQTRAAMAQSLLSRAFQAVFQEKLPADQYLKKVFRQDRRIGGRDRRFYADLIFGVFRWYGVLRRYSSDPAFYLAGGAAAENITDPSAALFLKKPGFDEVFHFKTPLERLNAFLHFAGIPESAVDKDCVPDWIFPHLDFTPDEAFFRILQSRSPLWLRVQRRSVDEMTLWLKEQGVDTVPHPVAGNALRVLSERINLPELEAVKKGWLEVQDLSSQCIGLACAPEPGQIWWDACAGGGGKSLQLASLMDGKGTITSSDVRENKLDELRRRAKRAAFSNIRTRVWDGIRPPVAENSCDGVLVDAPCSSSGRWRRNPESRWTLTEERVGELDTLQKKILDSASKAVKPGGVLVYATCSMFKDENRLTLEHFLAGYPEFEPEKFNHPLTGQETEGFVQILPQDGDCDAAFIARVRKKG